MYCVVFVVSVVCCGVVWRCVVWRGVVRCGAVWCGVAVVVLCLLFQFVRVVMFASVLM